MFGIDLAEFRQIKNAVMPISGLGEATGTGLPPASSIAQFFPDIPDNLGGGSFGDVVQPLTEEFMDIANNVALSKHYAHQFLQNWPLYVGGTAVVLYLVLRR
jgi:hypothetical protein